MPRHSKHRFIFLLIKKYKTQLENLQFSAKFNGIALKIKYRQHSLGGYICSVLLNHEVFGKAFRSNKSNAKIAAVSKAMDNLAMLYPILEIIHPHSITKAIRRKADVDLRSFLLQEFRMFSDDPTTDQITFNVSEYDSHDIHLLTRLASDLNFYTRYIDNIFAIWRASDFIAIYHHLKSANCSLKYSLIINK